MVIEEVRPHRIVYAKTLNFRTFLDVQPKDNGISIVVKHGRNKPENAFTISSDKELEAAKSQISQAFQEITKKQFGLPYIRIEIIQGDVNELERLFNHDEKLDDNVGNVLTTKEN